MMAERATPARIIDGINWLTSAISSRNCSSCAFSVVLLKFRSRSCKAWGSTRPESLVVRSVLKICRQPKSSTIQTTPKVSAWVGYLYLCFHVLCPHSAPRAGERAPPSLSWTRPTPRALHSIVTCLVLTMCDFMILIENTIFRLVIGILNRFRRICLSPRGGYLMGRGDAWSRA